MPWALIGILPDRQLHFEEVYTRGTERCYIRAIGPTLDQHVCIAFHVIAQRQPMPIMPVYALMPHEHKTRRLNGYVLVLHEQVSKPEQLRTPVL